MSDNLVLSIEKMEIRPGDILKINSSISLPIEQMMSIKEDVLKCLAKHNIEVPIIFCCKGIDVELEKLA